MKRACLFIVIVIILFFPILSNGETLSSSEIELNKDDNSDITDYELNDWYIGFRILIHKNFYIDPDPATSVNILYGGIDLSSGLKLYKGLLFGLNLSLETNLFYNFLTGNIEFIYFPISSYGFFIKPFSGFGIHHGSAFGHGDFSYKIFKEGLGIGYSFRIVDSFNILLELASGVIVPIKTDRDSTFWFLNLNIGFFWF